MKFEFIPCTLKYALLARKRSKTDGGTLFFALIDYYAFGKKQTFENEGMQVLFDLFVGDIDEFLAGRKKLSQTNANNASSKGNDGKSKNKKTKRDQIAANAIPGTSVGLPIDGNDGNAGDYDAVDCDDADNDGGGNDSNDADSSDDDGDGATDDDDSSLSADNIKPPEVVSGANGRSGSEGSLKSTIETNDGIDCSEFNATQSGNSDSCDGCDRNDRCEAIGAVDVVSESSDRSGSEVSLKNAIETNDDTNRNGRSDLIGTAYVTSNRNNRSDSIGSVDVVSESSDRSNDYESVVVPDVTNDRNNRDNTDSISQLAPVTNNLATAATYSSASVLPMVSTTENDTASTFARLRDLYNKTGDNESRAFELWQRLSAKDRAEALSYAESIAGNSGYRSYLYVFLRDKEWLKPKANSH